MQIPGRWAINDRINHVRDNLHVILLLLGDEELTEDNFSNSKALVKNGKMLQKVHENIA